MSRGELAHFLESSLRLLERELPATHRELRRTLRGRRVRIDAEGLPRILACDGTRFAWCDTDLPVDVEVGLDKPVIVDLVDGRATLEGALLEERLRLRGSLHALVVFDEALHVYLGGAVRCPSFPELYAEYRDGGGAAARPQATRR